MEDAEHRAGRPGLANVPRDEKGLTLPSCGSAGQERSGTTLRPTWLRVRGVEIEREVRAWLHADEDGLHVYESRHGAMDYWLARLHVGETVLVINDDSTSAFYRQPVAHVTLTPTRELKFDRYPDCMFVLLRRVRPVPSCALNEVERRGVHSNEQVGDGIGRHRTLAARIVPKAFEKAKHVALGMFGMTEAELMQGIAELRRENGR